MNDAGAIGTQAISDEFLPGAKRYVGKVRDVYLMSQNMAMVATGRQSAFDRHLASVPFKGQVLNQISLWWFEATKHIVPNHVVSSPHPSAVVGRRCTIFPIEFVVRGYMTGTTSTSMWTHYEAGERLYCGHTIPDGMTKNQKASCPCQPCAFVGPCCARGAGADRVRPWWLWWWR